MKKNLFSPIAESYQKKLISEISKYISESQEKYFKGYGLDRASKLKTSISDQLVDAEGLNETQLMWRIYSYLKMNTGEGPLDTSTDLRNRLLDQLCAQLSVTDANKADEKIAITIKQFAGLSPQMNDAELTKVVKLNCVQKALLTRRQEVQEKQIELHQSLQRSIGLCKLEDFESGCANRLLEEINGQWSVIEGLNTLQIYARVIELARMPMGKGLFGTSQFLRSQIVDDMCQQFKLDKAMVEAVVKSEMAKPNGYTVIGTASYRDANDGPIDIKCGLLMRTFCQEMTIRKASCDPDEEVKTLSM